MNGIKDVKIGLGHFLPGGVPLLPGVKGINETYRGWIEVDQSRIQAYVKFLHPWEIFNEALGSILCQMVGLPTPDAYIVRVERSDYGSSSLFNQNISDAALAFASHAMPMQSLSRHASFKTTSARRELIAKWKEWPDVLVFDQWIANRDRHAGNLLIGEQGEIYLIDHGMAFGRRNWSLEQLEAIISMVAATLWSDILEKVVTLPERVAAAARLQSACAICSSVDAKMAMDSTLVSRLLLSSHLEALVSFLKKRGNDSASEIAKVIGIPDLALRGQQ